MRFLGDFLQRLRSLLFARREDRELAEELRFHIEREIEKNLAAGLSPREARRQAHIKFGGVERMRERTREARGVGWLESLLGDTRYALRRLAARPGFAAVVVLTLALGIGANAAMFQIVEALRFRGLPVHEPERLAIVEVADMSRWQGRRTTGYPVLSFPLWQRIRDGGGPFEAALAWANTTFSLEVSGVPALVRGLYVSGDFFDVLGVVPALGRTFAADDDRRGCGLQGVVLGYGFWQRAFGGDPSVVGGRIALDAHPVSVLGVAQAGFNGLEVGRAFDVAVPICAQATLGDAERWIDDGAVWWLTVMGRVPPNRELGAVNAELEALSPALFREALPDGYPEAGVEAFLEMTLRAVPGGTGVSSLRSRYGDSFVALLALTGLVLLIVCTNLANLFLARGASRQRELAVRRALGASRWRLLREVSIESAVLGVAGAMAGLAVAGALSRRLVGFLGADLVLDLGLTRSTVLFVLGAATLSSAIFGLLPALRASLGSGESGMDAINDGRGAAGTSRGALMRRGLVVSQVALSFVLLFGALLFTGTLRNLLAVDAGFESAGVTVARADFRSLELSEASRPAFKRDLLDRVRSVSGVSSAAEVRHVPMDGTGSSATVLRRDGDGRGVSVRLNAVTERYLETLGIPILAGRGLSAGDAPDAAVAIVTPAFAARTGMGPDPVGESFEFEGWPSDRTMEVVGLVPDTKYFNLREEPVPTAFVPKDLLPDSRSYTDFMIRTSLRLDVLRDALQASVAPGSAQVSIDVRPFDDIIRDGLIRERLLSTVSLFFGVLAVIVAAVGIYGVMSHHVAQRRNDIGVRIALGARRRDILFMVLTRAGALLCAGLVLGSLLAFAASLPVRSFLFGLDATSVPAFAIAAALLVVTAALACYLPARRAAGLAPQVALRLE